MKKIFLCVLLACIMAPTSFILVFIAFLAVDLTLILICLGIAALLFTGSVILIKKS